MNEGERYHRAAVTVESRRKRGGAYGPKQSLRERDGFGLFRAGMIRSVMLWHLFNLLGVHYGLSDPRRGLPR